MAVSALAYLGVRSEHLSNWEDFACNLLGMQHFDKGGKISSFRMDDQMQRLVVSDEPGETLAFIGWEVSDKSDLEYYANRLDKYGYLASFGNKNLCDRRFVDELLFFYDPGGNRVELVYKPHLSEEAFVPSRPIEGFKTGPFGMGHAVLHVNDPEPLVKFYTEILRFSVSDYGLEPVPLYFFHVNGRHHSFAIISSGKVGFHHFMVEYHNLDDVGQGYDIAEGMEDAIAYTLGRHTNDYMTSFYAKSPSGFFVENGWGGRIIDTEAWEPHQTYVGPSFWGHERINLSERERLKFRQMRMKTASEGRRAPPIVNCPWLYSDFLK